MKRERKFYLGVILTLTCLCAALLFAAVHLFLVGFPGLFLLGCGFQYLYLRRRNLACSMIAHGIVNTIAFAVNLWA